MGHGELFIVGWPLPDVALSTISSIIGRRFLNSKGHLELITVNCFFAKCSLGGSANEPF